MKWLLTGGSGYYDNYVFWQEAQAIMIRILFPYKLLVCFAKWFLDGSKWEICIVSQERSRFVQEICTAVELGVPVPCHLSWWTCAESVAVWRENRSSYWECDNALSANPRQLACWVLHDVLGASSQLQTGNPQGAWEVVLSKASSQSHRDRWDWCTLQKLHQLWVGPGDSQGAQSTKCSTSFVDV